MPGIILRIQTIVTYMGTEVGTQIWLLAVYKVMWTEKTCHWINFLFIKIFVYKLMGHHSCYGKL